MGCWQGKPLKIEKVGSRNGSYRVWVRSFPSEAPFLGEGEENYGFVKEPSFRHGGLGGKPPVD